MILTNLGLVLGPLLLLLVQRAPGESGAGVRPRAPFIGQKQKKGERGRTCGRRTANVL